MNERDKTAQMMQDSAGNSWGTEAHFQAFADLIRADEREACAKVVDAAKAGEEDWDSNDWNQAVEFCAAAIRSRENT